jgi:hypothetical protein
MTKHLLAGVAALGLLTSVALAQGTPGSGTSTTTVTSTPNGGSSMSTTKRGTGWNGNEVTNKDTYKQRVTASSETHSTTETDSSSGGTTTQSTTTSKPQ